MIKLEKSTFLCPTHLKASKKLSEFSKNNSFSVSHRPTFQKQSFFLQNWQMLLGQTKLFVLSLFCDKSKDNSRHCHFFVTKAKIIPDIEQKTLTEKSCFRAQWALSSMCLLENLNGWGFDVLKIGWVLVFGKKKNSTRFWNLNLVCLVSWLAVTYATCTYW